MLKKKRSVAKGVKAAKTSRAKGATVAISDVAKSDVKTSVPKFDPSGVTDHLRLVSRLEDTTYSLFGDSAEGIRLPSNQKQADELSEAVLEDYFADRHAGRVS